MEYRPNTQAFMYKHFAMQDDPDRLSPVPRQTMWYFAGVDARRFLHKFKRA